MSDLEGDLYDRDAPRSSVPTAVGAGEVVLVGGADGKGKVSLAEGVVERGLERLRLAREAEERAAAEAPPIVSEVPAPASAEPTTPVKNEVRINVWSSAEIARRLQVALLSGSPTRRERELRAFANQVATLQSLVGQMAQQYNAAADAANSARAAFMKLAEAIGPDETEKILGVGPEAPPSEPAPVSEEERALAGEIPAANEEGDAFGCPHGVAPGFDCGVCSS